MEPSRLPKTNTRTLPKSDFFNSLGYEPPVLGTRSVATAIGGTADSLSPARHDPIQMAAGDTNVGSRPTYGVVAFSIIVQGLSIGRIFKADQMKHLLKRA